MPVTNDALPPTIKVGDGVSMTFLREEAYLSRVHILPDCAEEFRIPAHWHEQHDELFRVLQGRIEVLIGTKTRFYGPEDGEINIARGVVHSLHVVKGEECVFEERTEPMDDEKELFFRNLLATGEVVSDFFPAMQVMYHGDMRPVLPLHLMWMERALVQIMGGCLAPLLGYKLPLQSLRKEI